MEVVLVLYGRPNLFDFVQSYFGGFNLQGPARSTCSDSATSNVTMWFCVRYEQ